MAKRTMQTMEMGLKVFFPIKEIIEANLSWLLLSYRIIPQAERKHSPSALISERNQNPHSDVIINKR